MIKVKIFSFFIDLSSIFCFSNNTANVSLWKNFRFIMLKYSKNCIKEDFRILSMQHIIGISSTSAFFQV
jgi:hypothetical protein